jgi:acyl-CoA synthetase (AMP-forming)/AMP-acid ligase II
MSHYNLIANTLSMRATIQFMNNAHQKEVFFPSFAHIYGIVSGVLLSAFLGTYVEPMKKVDLLSYLQRCIEIDATILRLVPALVIRIVKDSEMRRMDLKSVRTVLCAGASLPVEIQHKLQQFLHPDAVILNAYGMTESAITMMRETRKDKPGSVGRPMAGVSIRIVDDEYNNGPLAKIANVS